MRKATHILNNNSPASFDELQTLLRPVERGGGGWVPDLEVRPFVYGTEEIKIVHLVKPEEEDEDLGIVFTVSVDHGPEAQKPWYDRGYRILSKSDSYAKNVVMTLVKKPERKETPPQPQEPEEGVTPEKPSVPVAVREHEAILEKMKREKAQESV